MRRPAPDSGPTAASAPAVCGRARYTKEARLRRRAQYLSAQAQGKRLSTPHFGLTVAAHPGARPRLGLVVSRRLGRAVTRNRVKRLLREWFRRHQALLPPADIIIVARKGAQTLTYQKVLEELARVLLPPGGVEISR